MAKVYTCKTRTSTHMDKSKDGSVQFIHSCLRGFIPSIISTDFNYPCEYASKGPGGGCVAPATFKIEARKYDYKKAAQERQKISRHMPTQVELEEYSQAYEVAIKHFYVNQNFDIKSICMTYCNMLFIENKFNEQRTLQIAEMEVYNIIEHWQKAKEIIRAVKDEKTGESKMHELLSKGAGNILEKFMPKAETEEAVQSESKPEAPKPEIKESPFAHLMPSSDEPKKEEAAVKPANPFAHLMPKD